MGKSFDGDVADVLRHAWQFYCAARASIEYPRTYVLASRRKPLSVMAFTVAEGRITTIRIVVDPAKLATIHLPDPA